MSQPTTAAPEDCPTGAALTRERLREKVLACLADAAEARGMRADLDLTDDSVPLESGLDSLGFAVLVVRLEESAAAAAQLPHRRKYLLLVNRFLERLVELHAELVDEVERELRPAGEAASAP